MSPIDRVLSALRERACVPKQSGKGWACRCPAHDDHSPSLSIGVSDDGRALVHCHAGCPTDDVLAAIGLNLQDLMPVPVTNTPRRTRRTKVVGTGSLNATAKAEPIYATAREAVAELERRHGQRSALWVYTDPDGSQMGIIIRWDHANGNKDFRPVSLNGSGWTLRGMSEPRPLYKLPALAKADCIYVTEGEKAADAAIACGLVATTSSHGSRSAAKSDWSALRGKEVVILPDHDDAGERYANEVSRLAGRAGARSVCIVRLADQWSELPTGGDIADVLELSGGCAEVVRSAIEKLVAAAEPEEMLTSIDSAQFVPFPVDELPEPIRSYIKDGAKAIGCDASYMALSMLSALASAIGNTHRIQLKRSWTEPAIIWTAIVGESGTAKSPALELALRAVRRRQDRALKEYATAMKAWEAEYARWEIEQATWKKDAIRGKTTSDPPEAPERPVCSRTWTDDITTEALVKKLQENPRGLLMVRDELSGWFNFDRYTGGKGGGDVAKWLEMFGGRSLIVDRKTSGTEHVPSASVSIAGGIQPETLRRSLGQELRDRGLAARLLFAMPPRRPKRWTEDDVDERIEVAVADVFDALYALEPATNSDGDPEPRLVRLSPNAKRAWVRFVNEHGAEQASRIGDEAAAWSKLECYCARFALVIHLTRVSAHDPTLTDPEVVDDASIAAGVALVRWFANEAERVYAILGGGAEDREQRQLVEWIEGKGGSVTARDLTKGLRAYRGDSAKAREALDSLVEAGWGAWDTSGPGKTGGRPTARFILGSSVPDTETRTDDDRMAGNGDGDSGDSPESDRE